MRSGVAASQDQHSSSRVIGEDRADCENNGAAHHDSERHPIDLLKKYETNQLDPTVNGLARRTSASRPAIQCSAAW